jgi:hypothetical protein
MAKLPMPVTSCPCPPAEVILVPLLVVRDENKEESLETWFDASESKYQEGDAVFDSRLLTSAI